MDKKFFTGLAVLLSASLFFLGCGGTDDDGGDPGSGKSAAETFADVFGGKADVAGNVVTLNADFTLSQLATVPADVTLKVPTGLTLTVAETGMLKGASGTAIVVISAGGTVAGAGNADFYPAEGTSVTAGIYVWDEAAGGAGTRGWKQTVADLTGSYSLKEGANTDSSTQSGISIASALKDIATKTVTIRLAGEFDAKYVYVGDGTTAASATGGGAQWESASWFDGSYTSTPLAGKYGAVNIGGINTEAMSNVAIQIKPYPGLLFYSGTIEASGGGERTLFASSELTVPATAEPFNYKSADGTVTQRWRFFPTIPANDIYGVLLYSGAANKTVTLDVDQWGTTPADGKAANGDILTVVVDYRDVVFPAELDVSESYSLKEAEVGDSATTATASGISIASALKNASTNTVTIRLAGTFGAKYIYAADGTTAAVTSGANVVGSKWDADNWFDGSYTCTPLAGKYGAVNVNGFFPAAKSNVAVQIKPYPGLLFSSGTITASGGGQRTLFASNELTAPATVEPFNYKSADGTVTQRWKLYSSFAQDANFGVLLYSGAANKTVTLDIDQWGATPSDGKAANGDILTVVIDYSDVVFPNAADSTS
jgi:hypothetical protein